MLRGMPRAVVRARVGFASGVAAAAIAALMLSGRQPGAVTTVIALCVVARAAAVVSSVRPSAARALARITATVPVWVALAVVGLLRAGSPDLADIRGAHAIFGLGVARGSPAMVAAVILASAAAALAVGISWTRLEDPPQRLAILGALLDVWLVVTIAAGPQVTRAQDAVAWTAGAVVAADRKSVV